MRKKNSCRPGRRYFATVVLLGFITLTILFCVAIGMSVVNTRNYEDLREEYDALRSEDGGKAQFSASNIDARINKSEYAWKRKVDARFEAIDDKFRTGVKEDEKTGLHVNSSFEKVAVDIQNLITSIDNLNLSLFRVNSSTDEKILHLRNILKHVKDDLKLTRSAMATLNGSSSAGLTRVSASLLDAVKDLRNDLRILNATINARADELWGHWNDTNSDIKMTLKEMIRQNNTIHLKVEYHSKALYAEVKALEKKLARLSNTTTVTTTKDKQSIETELNKTRSSLQQVFRIEITRANKSLYTAIDNLSSNLKSLITKVDTKIDAVKNTLGAKIKKNEDDQKKTKDDLSRTKVTLERNDRQHESNISALAVKIQNMKSNFAQLKDNLDLEKNKRKDLENKLQELRATVEELKNRANGIPRVHVSLIVLALLFMYCL